MILYNFLLHFMDDLSTLVAYRKRAKMLANPKTSKEKRMQLNNHFQFYAYGDVSIERGRLSNCTIPDHCFEGWNKDIVVNDKIHLKDVFCDLVPSCCKVLFHVNNENIVVVNDSQWDYWQYISRSFSPMVLKTIFLWSSNIASDEREEIIKKNFCNTALPIADRYVGKDISDVHIHWNKGMEADRAVIDLINDPGKFIKDNETNEQSDFRQRFGQNVYEEIYELALEAQDYIWEIEHQEKKEVNPFSKDDVLMYNVWWLWKDLESLKNKGKPNDFIALHYFLLVLGELRRRFVVQVNQFGIEQFNKTLKNPFRGWCDYRDGRQIKQVLGNQLNCCHRIEFRLASKQLASMNEIREGMRNAIHEESKRPLVDFVCSVSKGSKTKSISRYEKLLSNLDQTIGNIHSYSSEIVGIDITGKDFNISPDAFVDFCNELRLQCKIQCFTYHAGEDFFHVLSGLRTIYEVVRFLEFDHFCRIGHASAAGIDPVRWAMCVRDVVPMKQGEYLDDLIFAYHFIEDSHINDLENKKRQLEYRITGLTNDVYEQTFDFNDMHQAWLNRKNGIKTIIGNKSLDEIERIRKSYLDAKLYDKIIKVDCFEIFDAEDLRILQKELLRYLFDKGCAIEACPTSNVSIGYDHTLKSYHLKTWLKWKYIIGHKVPDIVIGSDEVGTFPTNIANEYACIYDMLKADNDFNDELIEKIMNDLIECSERRAFANMKS